MRGTDPGVVERIEKFVRARDAIVAEGGKPFTITLQCTFMCGPAAASPAAAALRLCVVRRPGWALSSSPLLGLLVHVPRKKISPTLRSMPCFLHRSRPRKLNFETFPDMVSRAIKMGIDRIKGHQARKMTPRLDSTRQRRLSSVCAASASSWCHAPTQTSSVGVTAARLFAQLWDHCRDNLMEQSFLQGRKPSVRSMRAENSARPSALLSTAPRRLD